MNKQEREEYESTIEKLNTKLKGEDLINWKLDFDHYHQGKTFNLMMWVISAYFSLGIVSLATLQNNTIDRLFSICIAIISLVLMWICIKGHEEYSTKIAILNKAYINRLS